MRNLIKFISLFILIFFFSSCVTVKLTHQQYMDNAVKGKSKEQVATTFGLPDQKQVEGNFEQWSYYKGQTTVTKPSAINANTNVNLNQFSNNATLNTRTIAGRSESETYDQYVKIMFQNDIGIKWETSGVDYEVSEPNNVGTVLTVIGTVGGGILLGVLMAMFL